MRQRSGPELEWLSLCQAPCQGPVMSGWPAGCQFVAAAFQSRSKREQPASRSRDKIVKPTRCIMALLYPLPSGSAHHGQDFLTGHGGGGALMMRFAERADCLEFALG